MNIRAAITLPNGNVVQTGNCQSCATLAERLRGYAAVKVTLQVEFESQEDTKQLQHAMPVLADCFGPPKDR